MNDIYIEYFNICKERFECADDDSEFQLSNNLEALLRNYFDVIDSEITASELPKITNEVIIKYIQINMIYESIMQNLYDIDMFDNYCDKRLYQKDNILTILEYITDGFYECINDLEVLCRNEKNVVGMVQCYSLNLKLVLNMIEFVESIKYID
jgi:hypothetical protein